MEVRLLPLDLKKGQDILLALLVAEAAVKKYSQIFVMQERFRLYAISQRIIYP